MIMIVDRKACITRKTNETDIQLELSIDGRGVVEMHTGVPFLDHMLTLFAIHGFFDLSVRATGDIHIDDHHSVEDIGICMGDALSRALGERKGIKRYGHAVVPMDEACAMVSLDLSNRPFLVYQVPNVSARVGSFETELVPEFFRAFCQHGGVTLHVHVLYGSNTHHIIEAVYKAWGRALEEACRLEEKRKGVPSSKGSL